jgi:hypothetical protein
VAGKLLQRQPGTEVVLTRRTDDFVSLPARTAIANRVGRSVLSIHANANDDASARGIGRKLPELREQPRRGVGGRARNAASGQSMAALPTS